MPHPMTRLCDRFRLKEFDFHSFAPRRRVVDMSGGPRRGSDSPDWMYLSGKAIHTFWAPRQGFQTDIYGPCVRIAAGGPTVPSPIPPLAQALCLSTRISVCSWLGCSQLFQNDFVRAYPRQSRYCNQIWVRQ